MKNPSPAAEQPLVQFCFSSLPSLSQSTPLLLPDLGRRTCIPSSITLLPSPPGAPLCLSPISNTSAPPCPWRSQAATAPRRSTGSPACLHIVAMELARTALGLSGRNWALSKPSIGWPNNSSTVSQLAFQRSQKKKNLPFSFPPLSNRTPPPLHLLSDLRSRPACPHHRAPFHSCFACSSLPATGAARPPRPHTPCRYLSQETGGK